MDLGAERLIAAERHHEKIAVEIKSFQSPSAIRDLEMAQGLMLVNPGSVGRPFAELPYQDVPRLLPWAEYAVVHWQHGTLGVE